MSQFKIELFQDKTPNSTTSYDSTSPTSTSTASDEEEEEEEENVNYRGARNSGIY